MEVVDRLIIGWVLLILVNVFLSIPGVEAYLIDSLAVFAKIIILYGMVDPRFYLFADEIKKYLVAGLPEKYSPQMVNSFALVNLGGGRSKEIGWIIRRLTENTKNGIRTVLIVFHDMISIEDLRRGNVSEDDFYLVRIIPQGKSSPKIFEDKIINIDNDLVSLEILLSNIIKFCKDKAIRCDIILYTLSWLIHFHGWNRMYSFLMGEMPSLKNSPVTLYAFYYPETHEEKSVVSKFEKLCDEIICE
jgi:hypothetical protein